MCSTVVLFILLLLYRAAVEKIKTFLEVITINACEKVYDNVIRTVFWLNVRSALSPLALVNWL